MDVRVSDFHRLQILGNGKLCSRFPSVCACDPVNRRGFNMKMWSTRDRLRTLGALMFIAQSLGFSTHCSPARPAATIGFAQASIKTLDRQKAASPVQDPVALCDRLGDIKVLSFHPEDAQDPVYLEFVKAGNSVIPCLIEKVTDATPTPDPREAPKADTTIGDIAYFVLVRITPLDFTEMLPDEVRASYRTEGVYAYFNYVASGKNRKELRDRLRAWYRSSHEHVSSGL